MFELRVPAKSKISADPASQSRAASYKLMIGSIVPRPIAFVSTISASGIPNLAPFSFFNAVCADPPSICFSVGNRRPAKDTIANIRAVPEFVVNIVNEDIAGQMNVCSGDYAAEVNEFEVSGLTPEVSEVVKPPCVLESPMSMECRLVQIVDVGTAEGGASLVIGEVVMFHVDASIVTDYRIDPGKLRAIGRMGGRDGYVRTRDYFEIERPGRR